MDFGRHRSDVQWLSSDENLEPGETGASTGLMKTLSSKDRNLLRSSCFETDFLQPCSGFAIREIQLLFYRTDGKAGARMKLLTQQF